MRGAPLSEKPIRVLVADDSELFRELLARVIALGPGFEVVATVGDGKAAAELARICKPDVITMDLDMPGVDGYSGIARIMAETPTPILVLTAYREEAVGFRALSLGALDILEKPSPHSTLDEYGAILRSRLRLLAAVRVIRHPRGARSQGPVRSSVARPEIVVIGASLGGPRALASLLHALPASFPTPILVVQHIADGFTEGLSGWLSQEAALEVRSARDRDELRGGLVLVAPSKRHLVVSRGVARLSNGPPVDTFKPSVTPLFVSAAEAYGSRVCGIVLTGMGRDGEEGVRALKRVGAHVLAQDEATSVVFGMPRAAMEAGADRLVPLEEIPRLLQEMAG